MSTETMEERVERLEELAAHQARTIDELSQQLTAQWSLIDRMKRQIEEMTDRFDDLEDRARAAQPTQKPPHW